MAGRDCGCLNPLLYPMKPTLRATMALVSMTFAGAAFAAPTCTADVARMKRLDDRAPAPAAATAPATSGITLAQAKKLDGAGMVVPSASLSGGLTLAEAKRLDRMPAAGRGRDIAGSCL